MIQASHAAAVHCRQARRLAVALVVLTTALACGGGGGGGGSGSGGGAGPSAPSAPSALAAATTSSATIHLTWTDSSDDETGFELERSPDGTAGWSQIATPAANATSHDDTGLSPSTAYYYRLRATNAAGDSAYSSVASATTRAPAVTIPAAPSALAAAATSSSSIHLTWTDSSDDEAGFKLERSPDGTAGWTQIATPAANATSHDDTGLSAATHYYYRLRATNAAGDSAYSGSANATTGLATPLLVSQIRTRGEAGAADEFVELYNPATVPVALNSSFKLEGRSSGSGAGFSTRWTGGGHLIPGHGHFLIAGTSYSELPAADERLSVSIADASSLELTFDGTRVDGVCFAYDATSAAAFTDPTYECEGRPVTNNPHDNTLGTNADSSIERRPGGAAGNALDTGDNAADFQVLTPAAPRSSSSPPAP